MACLASSFLFNDTAPTEIYTLSLHDALPISLSAAGATSTAYLTTGPGDARRHVAGLLPAAAEDRKSTRLNSSHRCISYAVFCLKKKKNETYQTPDRAIGACITVVEYARHLDI